MRSESIDEVFDIFWVLYRLLKLYMLEVYKTLFPS